MQTCKTCRHWITPTGWRWEHPAGCCTRQGKGDDAAPSAFCVATEGSDLGDLLTGPDFGCVAHEPQAEVVREDDAS